MLPSRLVCNYALRLLLDGRNGDEREELLAQLYAPEGGWEESQQRALERAAHRLQILDPVVDADPGPGAESSAAGRRPTSRRVDEVLTPYPGLAGTAWEVGG